MFLRILALLCLAGALTVAPPPLEGPFGRTAGTAAAQSPQDRARDAARRGEVLPLEAVLARVARRVPGRVLDADLRQTRRGYVYVIKVLGQGGALSEVTVNAADGRILSVRGSR